MLKLWQKVVIYDHIILDILGLLSSWYIHPASCWLWCLGSISLYQLNQQLMIFFHILFLMLLTTHPVNLDDFSSHLNQAPSCLVWWGWSSWTKGPSTDSLASGKMLQEKAIGVLVDGNSSLQSTAGTSLLGRLFTREDGYNIHKVLLAISQGQVTGLVLNSGSLPT